MLNAQYWEGDLLLGPSSYEYYSSIEDELNGGAPGGAPGGPPGAPGGPPGGPPGPPGGPPGPPGGPGGPSSFGERTNNFKLWQAFGGARITGDGYFIVPHNADSNAGYRLIPKGFEPNTAAYSMTFLESGSIKFKASVPDNSNIDVYFKFHQNAWTATGSEYEYATEIFTLSGNSVSEIVIDIPNLGSFLTKLITMHIVTRDANLLVESISITDNSYGNLSLDPYAYSEFRGGLKILDCNEFAEGSIAIPSYVTEIGPRAFINCDEITSIVIGQRHEAIKDEVFLIHGGAFSNAEKLNAIFVDKEVKVEIAEPYLAQFDNNRASNILLDESLSSWDIIIHDPHYYNGLSPRLILEAGSNISFEDFENIIDSAYIDNHYSDKSIHHPSSWISKYNVVLKEEIVFETTSFTFGLNSRSNYTLIDVIGTLPSIVDIPSTVNGHIVDEIGPAAFYQNDSIHEINIPSSIKIIGDNAFSGCLNLAKVNLNEGIETISGNAFSLCGSLESILMPKSLNFIGEFAFSGCNLLNKVIMLGDSFFSFFYYRSGYFGSPFYGISPTIYAYSRSSGWRYSRMRFGQSYIELKFNPSITLSDSYQIKSGDSLTLSALSYDLFKDFDGDGHLDVDEDINENGDLDLGEDIDADGNLDQSEPLTETVNGYQWHYGVFPIAQSLGGNDESFTILGEEQYEGFWKLELLQDGAVISSHEFYVSVYNDTDSDGLNDEVETGTGVYLSTDNTGTNPSNSDSDGDNLSDGDEVLIYQTDPNNADSDGDTLTDGDEILIHQTDPNNTDSDGDSILDHTEIMNGTNPNLADTDSDGLDDSQEITYGTDPNLADTSGDGLTDGIIVNAGFDPTVDYSNLLNQRPTQADIDAIIAERDARPTQADYDSIVAERDARPTQASYDAVVAERDAKLSIEQVKDLRPSSTMIEVSENQATVQLKMQESSDLKTWEDTGAPTTITIPADADTKFFRFAMIERFPFRLVFGDFSWEEAKIDAELKGGRLAVLDTEEKLELFNSYLLSLKSWPNAWIGLTDKNSEGNFEWINGTSLSVENWYHDEPNNAFSGEDYVHVWHSEWYDAGTWNDLDNERTNIGLPEGGRGGNYFLEYYFDE